MQFDENPFHRYAAGQTFFESPGQTHQDFTKSQRGSARPISRADRHEARSGFIMKGTYLASLGMERSGAVVDLGGRARTTGLIQITLRKSEAALLASTQLL